MKTMTVYKLRAECMIDVEKATNALGVEMRSTGRAGYPDVEVEFKSDRSLEFIRGVLSTVEDGHVMLETVQPKSAYTGERAKC